jgi:ribose 5-phosphate isomerase B
MNIAIAADHAGFDLKQHLIPYLREKGYAVLDLGVESAEKRSDYPDVARVVGEAVTDGRAERGILICGSGVGACIAANKMTGVYAAICHDTYSAAQGVEHDNMNVLCLGGRIVGVLIAETLVNAFLGATFQSGTDRYVKRFEKVQAMEQA